MKLRKCYRKKNSWGVLELLFAVWMPWNKRLIGYCLTSYVGASNEKMQSVVRFLAGACKYQYKFWPLRKTAIKIFLRELAGVKNVALTGGASQNSMACKRGVNQKIPLSFAVTASVIMQKFYQTATDFGLWRSETNSNFSGEPFPLTPFFIMSPRAILPQLLSHCKVHPKSKSRGNDLKVVGLEKSGQNKPVIGVTVSSFILHLRTITTIIFTTSITSIKPFSLEIHSTASMLNKTT